MLKCCKELKNKLRNKFKFKTKKNGKLNVQPNKNSSVFASRAQIISLFNLILISVPLTKKKVSEFPICFVVYYPLLPNKLLRSLNCNTVYPCSDCWQKNEA